MAGSVPCFWSKDSAGYSSRFTRPFSSEEAGEPCRNRLTRELPVQGHVRLLLVTDRQFAKMRTYFGKKHAPIDLCVVNEPFGTLGVECMHENQGNGGRTDRAPADRREAASAREEAY
ncbi:MAG TPA: hypothetical protein VHX65_18400, partial [Pirellulales bacterium]|nr:hypothetical protein [Pirellulales bacterium]